MNRSVFWKISYGLYVVTAWTDGRPTGCIVNSIMQVTSKPATFAVSINNDNFTADCVKKSGKLAINVLAEDTPPSVIGTFGFKSGRDTDKFADIPYTVQSRLPVLTDAIGYIVCDVTKAVDMGTHTVFMCAVTADAVVNDKKEMTYAYYHEVIKGTAPKTAPTFIEAAADAAIPKTKKYRCTVCGYIHEGELPPDFTCPICGVGPDMFEPVE